MAQEAIQDVIQRLHGCRSTWVEAAPEESFGGEIVWKGVVEVFELEGHATATRCYAWAYETDDGETHYTAVLHQGLVDSPVTAVRAAIIQEHRERGGS